MAAIVIHPPAAASAVARIRPRATARRWSVRHARALERVYAVLADVLARLHGFWSWVGYERAERPVRAIEKTVKRVLFDCRMCGRCVLSQTGMSCPMTCPKSLRNGPCGGVRANGHCEVDPDMACVWVDAWQGSRRMAGGEAILMVQPPVDHRLVGTSAWLRASAETAAARSPCP